jgi:hypothetical protein
METADDADDVDVDVDVDVVAGGGAGLAFEDADAEAFAAKGEGGAPQGPGPRCHEQMALLTGPGREPWLVALAISTASASVPSPADLYPDAEACRRGLDPKYVQALNVGVDGVLELLTYVLDDEAALLCMPARIRTVEEMAEYGCRWLSERMVVEDARMAKRHAALKGLQPVRSGDPALDAAYVVVSRHSRVAALAALRNVGVPEDAFEEAMVEGVDTVHLPLTLAYDTEEYRERSAEARSLVGPAVDAVRKVLVTAVDAALVRLMRDVPVDIVGRLHFVRGLIDALWKDVALSRTKDAWPLVLLCFVLRSLRGRHPDPTAAGVHAADAFLARVGAFVEPLPPDPFVPLCMCGPTKNEALQGLVNFLFDVDVGDVPCLGLFLSEEGLEGPDAVNVVSLSTRLMDSAMPPLQQQSKTLRHHQMLAQQARPFATAAVCVKTVIERVQDVQGLDALQLCTLNPDNHRTTFANALSTAFRIALVTLVRCGALSLRAFHLAFSQLSVDRIENHLQLAGNQDVLEASPILGELLPRRGSKGFYLQAQSFVTLVAHAAAVAEEQEVLRARALHFRRELDAQGNVFSAIRDSDGDAGSSSDADSDSGASSVDSEATLEIVGGAGAGASPDARIRFSAAAHFRARSDAALRTVQRALDRVVRGTGIPDAVGGGVPAPVSSDVLPAESLWDSHDDILSLAESMSSTRELRLATVLLGNGGPPALSDEGGPAGALGPVKAALCTRLPVFAIACLLSVRTAARKTTALGAKWANATIRTHAVTLGVLAYLERAMQRQLLDMLAATQPCGPSSSPVTPPEPRRQGPPSRKRCRVTAEPEGEPDIAHAEPCALCMDPVPSSIGVRMTACGHVLCLSDAVQAAEARGMFDCPACGGPGGGPASKMVDGDAVRVRELMTASAWIGISVGRVEAAKADPANAGRVCSGCGWVAGPSFVQADDVAFACLHCATETCRGCMDILHPGLVCPVALARGAGGSDTVSVADLLSEAKLVPCPSCRAPITKDSGCNHMTCRQPDSRGVPCGTDFCFLCGDAISVQDIGAHYATMCYGPHQRHTVDMERARMRRVLLRSRASLKSPYTNRPVLMEVVDLALASLSNTDSSISAIAQTQQDL